MIREAQEADLDRLVEMGQRFLRESSYKAHLSDNPEQMRKLAKDLTERNSVLVAEEDGQLIGMLGFLIYDHFISGEKTCGEVFWWLEKEHRGAGLKLLRETEKRARLAGASHVQMIAPNERVAGLYRRLGYQYVESTYHRTL